MAVPVDPHFEAAYHSGWMQGWSAAWTCGRADDPPCGYSTFPSVPSADLPSTQGEAVSEDREGDANDEPSREQWEAEVHGRRSVCCAWTQVELQQQDSAQQTCAKTGDRSQQTEPEHPRLVEKKDAAAVAAPTQGICGSGSSGEDQEEERLRFEAEATAQLRQELCARAGFSIVDSVSDLDLFRAALEILDRTRRRRRSSSSRASVDEEEDAASSATTVTSSLCSPSPPPSIIGNNTNTNTGGTNRRAGKKKKNKKHKSKNKNGQESDDDGDDALLLRLSGEAETRARALVSAAEAREATATDRAEKAERAANVIAEVEKRRRKADQTEFMRASASIMLHERGVLLNLQLLDQISGLVADAQPTASSARLLRIAADPHNELGEGERTAVATAATVMQTILLILSASAGSVHSALDVQGVFDSAVASSLSSDDWEEALVRVRASVHASIGTALIGRGFHCAEIISQMATAYIYDHGDEPTVQLTDGQKMTIKHDAETLSLIQQTDIMRAYRACLAEFARQQQQGEGISPSPPQDWEQMRDHMAIALSIESKK